MLAVTEGQGPSTQGRLMSGWSKARIQLCGRLAVDIDGSRIEDTLPGRRGRVLFAYLVLNRGRPVSRDELLMAGWAAARRALDTALLVPGVLEYLVTGTRVPSSWIWRKLKPAAQPIR
jgi:hypothetical protein